MVAVPSASCEAARDLARAREQVRADLMRLPPPRLEVAAAATGASTTAAAPGHRRTDNGSPASGSSDVATELAYLDTLAAIDGLLARRAALDERLSLLAVEPEHWPTVARLRCFRGIDTLTALVLHLEIGDFGRFQRPGQLAAWLGLVPSLRPVRREPKRAGPITKTGSGYARRLLVEAAWHYLREPRIGVTLHNRQAGQPDHVLQIAWRAQHRLYRLHQRLRARGKPANVAIVAVARELACFVWAAAVAD